LGLQGESAGEISSFLQICQPLCQPHPARLHARINALHHPQRHAPQTRPGRPSPPERFWLYGLHATQAALANPARPCHRLVATRNALQRLGSAAEARGVPVEQREPGAIGTLLPPGAVHQGVALEVGALPARALEPLLAELPKQALLLALDQVTDPRNLGAILRSAAAFDVAAVILPERRSAELSGACAKAASGALDIVPVVDVANLARALEACKAQGFWALALDAEGERPIEEATGFERRVLVVGAEGSGIRRLVGETCDLSVRLPMSPRIESLNVATAAGIALYALAAPGRAA
jgi:23S rRNA (guanosine2251-2'-O)-methyltransferase